MAKLNLRIPLHRAMLCAKLEIFRKALVGARSYREAAARLGVTENYFGRYYRQMVKWEEGERAKAEAIAKGQWCEEPAEPPRKTTLHVERPAASKESTP